MDILKAALEISIIGVWNFNEKDNTVFFSKPSKSIIGFEDDDTFGNNINDWNDRVHPDDRETYFQDFQDHINGLNPLYINKHRIMCKDGTYKWILDKGKIINNHKKDGYVHFVGTHTDITKDVEIEKTITNALSIATKQNSRLKNFAHIVTHNLKLHSGNFESILEFYDDTDSPEEKDELIDHLKEVSKSLNKTIKNLNQIVSVQTEKHAQIEKLVLNDFVKSTLKVLQLIIVESNTKIIYNIDKAHFIYLNYAYLESVFQNLTTNAIKYKHPERDPVITIASEIKDENIIITFNDNGIGIDLDKFGKDIFGLYKTFHYNKEAEGVGLYLVKNQIESFNGKIDVKSTVNVGTTFTITLPYSTKKPT